MYVRVYIRSTVHISSVHLWFGLHFMCVIVCFVLKEIVSARHSGKGDAKAKLDPFRYIDELHQILITPMKTYHSPVTLETEEDPVEEPKKEEKERKDSSNSGSSSDEDSCSSGDQDQDDYSELLLKKDIPPDNLPMLIARVMSRGKNGCSSIHICTYVRMYVC